MNPLLLLLRFKSGTGWGAFLCKFEDEFKLILSRISSNSAYLVLLCAAWFLLETLVLMCLSEFLVSCFLGFSDAFEGSSFLRLERSGLTTLFVLKLF